MIGLSVSDQALSKSKDGTKRVWARRAHIFIKQKKLTSIPRTVFSITGKVKTDGGFIKLSNQIPYFLQSYLTLLPWVLYKFSIGLVCDAKIGRVADILKARPQNYAH